MARIALTLLLAVSAISCFDVSFGDGTLSCASSKICPAGMACIGDICVREVTGGVDAAVADVANSPDAVSSVRASCLAHRDSGITTSGIYQIDRGGGSAFEAYCDMDTAGGGWTLLVNNDTADLEPSDCVPRIASTSEYVCGDVRIGQDFAIAANGIPFTEMIWATYEQPFEIAGYQRFGWSSSQTIVAEEFWTLTADESSLEIVGSNLPIIECQYSVIGGSALVRVANEAPRAAGAGAWVNEPMITIFDMDNVTTNPGRMSFTDATSATGSLGGLDDFQDGFGCSDMFTPTAQRGFASFIMVR